jgi:8-oxo-dGTP pyrophosphatase MutT (NUDIX family)
MEKERSSAAKGLLLYKDKYLLLLRNPKDDIHPFEWDLPGGGANPGETERENLIREVKEESGIDISSCDIILAKEWMVGGEANAMRGVDSLCILKEEPAKIILSEEHVRSRWFTKDEILNGENIPEWIKETLTKSLRHTT